MVNTRVVAVFAAFVVLSGCAAPNRVHIDSVKIHSKATFTLVDARPLDETRGEVKATRVSEWVEYGDDQLTPPRMAILRTRLQDKLGVILSGKTITVKTYKVWVNRYRYEPDYRNPYGNPLFWAIEDAKLDRTVACEIIVEVDSKQVESVIKEGAPVTAITERVQAVVVKAIDGLVDKIAQGLDPKSSQPAEQSESRK